MAHPLNKRITRRSEEIVRDRRKERRIVVTLYPAGYIGFRLEKCQKEHTLSIGKAHRLAIEADIAHKRAEKAKAKGGKFLAKRGKL